MDEFQIKLSQLVREIFPAASDVAILSSPLNAAEVRMLPALRQSRPMLGLTIPPSLLLREDQEIEQWTGVKLRVLLP